MKIILLSIGTRGDMEPFLSLGDILKEKGHEVICAFPEQFRDLAEDSNMEFASLGSKFIEMLDSDVAKAAMGGGGSGLNKLFAMIRLARKSTDSNKELVNKQYEIIDNENPDRIVYNGKAMYPVIWGLKNRGRNILISPVPYMHYVRGHTHIAFNSNYGSFLNKLTYSLANFGLITTVMISKRWLKIEDKISRKQILFITFGSMVNPEPKAKTKIIIEILELLNNSSFKNKAGQVSSQMQKENFREEIYNSIVKE